MSTTFSVSNLPKLRYGTTAEVAAAPVSDGTVLVDISSWRVYVDLGGQRLDLNTPVPVTTAANLPAQADRVPGKLYVALDTWTIYISDGTQWHALEPWRYVADAELSDSSSNPIANKAVSSALKGKADLVAGKVPSGQLPLATGVTDGAYGAVRIYNHTLFGITIGNTYKDLQIYPPTNADIANRRYKRPIVAENLNYAVTAALTDANHLTLTAEQQATAKSVLGVVDLPSGGTDGQLLAATSDSGVYAWVDPPSGGAGVGTELVMALTDADVAGSVTWAQNHASVTVVHSLTWPAVRLYDAGGHQLLPDITQGDGQVTLGFGEAVTIGSGAEWTLVLDSFAALPDGESMTF